MPKCPNCGQETARTMDWACQWCGYPLLSKSYKEIPKTYKQLKAELKPKAESEPEPAPEPELIPEPELEPEPVAEPEPVPKPELTPTEIGITVGELYSVYRDKFLADTELTDKSLTVTGMVDKIVVNDMHEIYYIILTSVERKAEQHVRCTFDKKDGAELNRLTVGQTVTVQGEYDGYRINLLMRDCVLVP